MGTRNPSVTLYRADGADILTIVDDSSWEPDGVTLQVRFCEGGKL
jgi:hypothetical protein